MHSTHIDPTTITLSVGIVQLTRLILYTMTGAAQRSADTMAMIPARITLADIELAPPVNIAIGEPVVVVLLLDVVLLELMAAQELKFWPPRNTPTVCASVI